jgi:hypothetical protein
MFHMLEASDVRELLSELGRFLEFWFGPRAPEFGEPVGQVQGCSLPFPLAWFYEFAGRWPPGVPGYTLEDFFYTGAGGHHLYPLAMVEPRPDGRLEFSSEYQGDWTGLTLPAGEDPPVWIEGTWIDESNYQKGEKRTYDSLSRFLVTHCLMAIIYEDDNSPSQTVMATPRGRNLGWSPASGQRLVERFLTSPVETELLWDSSDCDLQFYNGTFYLLHEGILVHRDDSNSYAFRAIHPEGIRTLEAHSA